jgi:hypothetical protein
MDVRMNFLVFFQGKTLLKFWVEVLRTYPVTCRTNESTEKELFHAFLGCYNNDVEEILYPRRDEL